MFPTLFNEIRTCDVSETDSSVQLVPHVSLSYCICPLVRHFFSPTTIFSLQFPIFGSIKNNKTK